MNLRAPSAALSLCLGFALLAASPAAGQGAPKKPVDPEKARAARAELDAKKMKFTADDFEGRVLNGDVAAVRLYLDAGIDPDVGDGKTPPLQEAAVRGYVEVVETLLAYGANPNAKNNNGATPLQEAVVQKQTACVKALLKGGANPNLAYKGAGDTPLIRASNVGSPETLLALLEGGADPNRGDSNGSTALTWEAQNGNVETVKALLAKGADPNARAAGGATPLMMAVMMQKPEVVKLLLAGGATMGKDREMLLQSANPEIKKILQNPPPAKKAAPAKKGTK